MKRFILSSLVLGACVILPACSEETKKEAKVTTTTPTGTEEKTVIEKDKKTGDMKDGAAFVNDINDDDHHQVTGLV